MSKRKESLVAWLSCLILGIGMAACGQKDVSTGDESGETSSAIMQSQESGESKDPVDESEPVDETPSFEMIKEDLIALDGPSVGDEITFGEYMEEPIKWIVLDRDRDSVLLLSKNLLDAGVYGGTNWENSRLRSWLNHGFYEQAFNYEEQKKIRLMPVWFEYQSSDGTMKNKKVCDMVSLISQEELDAYFTTAEDREAFVSVAYANQMLQSDVGYIEGWWLRSPVVTRDYPFIEAACVDDSGEYCYNEAMPNSFARSIRPMIRMKLHNVSTGYYYASTVTENIEIARQCLGMEVREAIDFLQEAYDFYALSASAGYIEGDVFFLGDDIDVAGVSIKRIHFFLDGNQRIKEVDFCITQEQTLSMGEEMADDVEDDLNLPAKEAFGKMVPRINGLVQEAGTDCDMEWIKATESGGLTWQYGEMTIAAIWGENCYSIEGNDQFELIVTSDKEFVPGKNLTWSSGAPLDPEIQSAYDLIKECIGQDHETAKDKLQKFCNVELGEGEYYEVGEPFPREEYLYYDQLSLGGIECSAVSIVRNPSTKKVYCICFLMQSGSTSVPVREFFQTYMEKLTATFGKPDIDGYGDYKYDIGDGITAEYGISGSGGLTVEFMNKELNE